MKRLLLSITLCFPIAACDPFSFFPNDVQGNFADQGFKTAIAHIELHKTRTGKYPDHISDIKYLGDWDPIYNKFVVYKKLESGYQLDLLDEKLSDQLSYPPRFWSGLGIAATNVQGFSANNRLKSDARQQRAP